MADEACFASRNSSRRAQQGAVNERQDGAHQVKEGACWRRASRSRASGCNDDGDQCLTAIVEVARGVEKVGSDRAQVNAAIALEGEVSGRVLRGCSGGLDGSKAQGARRARNVGLAGTLATSAGWKRGAGR